MPRADFHPPDSATRVRASLLLAAALHAAALLFWKIPPASPGTLENPQGAVEVSLVLEAPSAGSHPAETPAPNAFEPPKSPPPPPEPPMADAPKPPDLLVTEPRLTPIPNLPPPPAPLPAPPNPAPAPHPVPEQPPPAEPPKPPQAPPQPEQPAPPKTTPTPPRATAATAKATPSPGGPKAAQNVAQTPSLTPGPASPTPAPDNSSSSNPSTAFRRRCATLQNPAQPTSRERSSCALPSTPTGVQ